MNDRNPYSAPESDPQRKPVEYCATGPFIMERIGRVRYWVYSCAATALWMAFLLFAGPFDEDTMLITVIPTTIFGLVIGVRRCHDLNHSGWFVVLTLVPLIGLFFSLYILFAQGNDDANQYGAPPPPNTQGETVAAFALPIIAGIIAYPILPQLEAFLVM